jgi:twinkle protein
LGRYSDGHGYCFGCGYYEAGEGEAQPNTRRQQLSSDLIHPGEPAALTKRKLSEETCSMWGYGVGEFAGQKVQIANYRRDGVLVFQKVRFANKDFLARGDIKEAGLYGQHLWRNGGRKVVITEGEIDALSVSQAQGNKWPVVSVPNGAKGAKKAISRELEWLEQFEEVILMLDNDEEGHAASQECAGLFRPGRCKIARLPLKDASDMLQAGRGSEIIDAIWGAKSWRPDGVKTIADVREAVLTDPVQGFPWWSEQLTKLTYGRRLGECYAFGAGTGVGKTDWLAEQIMYDVTRLNEPVAVFMLEQRPQETVKRVAGKLASKRFHVPDGSWVKDELATTLDSLEASGKLFLYDSFGATDWEIIRNTIRFLAHSEGVKLFFLDHLTALGAAEVDENNAIKRIMAEIGGLVNELGIILHFVSHLSTPEGKSHEEGGRVMIRHFRGSRAIGYWSVFMFGLERNQQEENKDLRRVITFRVLKDRFTGVSTGETVFFTYDPDRGRLVELDHDPFAEQTDPQVDQEESPF